MTRSWGPSARYSCIAGLSTGVSLYQCSEKLRPSFEDSSCSRSSTNIRSSGSSTSSISISSMSSSSSNSSSSSSSGSSSLTEGLLKMSFIFCVNVKPTVHCVRIYLSQLMNFARVLKIWNLDKSLSIY